MQKCEKFTVLLSLTTLLSTTPHIVMAQQDTGSTPAQNSGKSSGSNSPTSAQPTLPPLVPSELPGMTDSDIANRQARLRNTDRQQQIILDTEKLLALANELKVDVDKSTKNTLSLDVIRKADEIERLAHAVKEKMKAE